MTTYDNTNRFVLFVNDRREKDTHPHWKGEGNHKGEDVWISAWEKESKSGKRMITGSFTPKNAQQNYGNKPAYTPPASNEAPADLDDDLPF